MERRDGKPQTHPVPDPVERMELMERIWALKREHKTFVEIGEELGISGKTAWKLFHEYELFLVPPQVEQERLLHIEQILEKLSVLQKMLDRYKEPEIQLKIMAEIRAWMKDYRRFMDMEGTKNVKHTVQSQFDAEMASLNDEFAEFRDRAEREATKEREQRRGRFHS